MPHTQAAAFKVCRYIQSCAACLCMCTDFSPEAECCNCWSSSQVLFRGNWSICRSIFVVSMRGIKFRLFLHHSLEPSLLGFQMATFSLCVHMVFPQYTHTSGICNVLISSYYNVIRCTIYLQCIIPPLIRIPVRLGQGPPQCPHIHLITALRTVFANSHILHLIYCG